MAARPQTIREIDFAGHDVRVWCFRCARGAVVGAAGAVARFTARGWPLDLTSAAARFRCRSCRRHDAVLLLPASRPGARKRGARPLTWAEEVAGFFHASRAARKRARRGF